MLDVLATFGVDIASIPDETGKSYKRAVPGRVAHIDADFIAYQTSAETNDELSGVRSRRTLDKMKQQTREILDHLMRMAQAERYVAHITPSASTKAGRAAQAVLKPYQANRTGRSRPENLDAIRAFMGEELGAVVHLDQEADDGLTQANVAAIDAGMRDTSVIVSMDKDLRMAPGLHYDYATETVIDPASVNKKDPDFGDVWIDSSKSSKKLVGWGTKFFWAQCLMGDAADNISGLPAVSGEDFLEASPTKAYTALMKRYVAAEDTDEAATYSAQIDAMHRKSKPCGVVMTHTLLRDCTTDLECYKRVLGLWSRCPAPIVHHETQAAVSPTVALYGDMQTLWMRRYNRKDDLLIWLTDTVLAKKK